MITMKKSLSLLNLGIYLMVSVTVFAETPQKTNLQLPLDEDKAQLEKCYKTLKLDSADALDLHHQETIYKTAKQGEATNQYELGATFERCQDYPNAAKWYRAAAERGHVKAQISLAELYYAGLGVMEDKENAIYWLSEAAFTSDVAAQFQLGQISLYDGQEEDAVFWFGKAAEQGYREAQSSLAQLYASGRGVKLDLKLAMYWYKKAIDQGDIWAMMLLDNLCDEHKELVCVTFK